MKIKRMLALLMSAATMITMFAACGKGDESKEGETTTVAATQADNSGSDAPADVDIDKGFTATKIGSYSVEKVSMESAASGLIYRDANGKYGIVSADGKNNTGAIYTSCEAVGEYFSVTDATSINSAADFNCKTLVDSTGKTVVSEKYAMFKALNGNYYQAFTVTEETTSEDDFLLYLSSSSFQVCYMEGNKKFKGNWVVYDDRTGKAVSGISGTNNYRVYAYGDMIEYVTDAEEKTYAGPNGKTLPEEAKIIDNGYYFVQTDANIATVHSADSTKLFDLTIDTLLRITSASENSFIVYNGSKYYIVDKKGTKISADFDNSIAVSGELVVSDGNIYDFDGNLILDADISSIGKDMSTGNVWFFTTRDGGRGFMKKDGTILYEKGKDDDVSVFFENMYAMDNSTRKCYSFADKDFTLNGQPIAPWLVRASTEDGNVRWIVDTLSGNKIIEGYIAHYTTYDANATLYIHAADGDGNVDIFKVS